MKKQNSIFTTATSTAPTATNPQPEALQGSAPPAGGFAKLRRTLFARVVLVLTLVLALALAACSSDSNSNSAGTTTPDTKRASYTVTFNTDGGSSVSSQMITEGEKVVPPWPLPKRAGHTFVNWFTSAATNIVFNFSAPISNAVTVYAGWELKTYSVTFVTNAGAPAFTMQNVLYTNKVSQPDNPSRSNYAFGGWYTDSAFRNAFSFTTAITGNLTLYAKWGATGDFNTLIAAGNDDPVGIWSDGTTMWVVDDADVKIYAYNLRSKARDADKDFNTLSAAGNSIPKGIWSDGTTMWVSDRIRDKIYAYSMSSKARDSSKDFNTISSEATEPRGLWSDGTTMWVADAFDGKIYAYNLGSKARDQSKDFNTLNAAGNNNPQGIWSDGTTMWVADHNDKKIYAYDLGTKVRTP